LQSNSEFEPRHQNDKHRTITRTRDQEQGIKRCLYCLACLVKDQDPEMSLLFEERDAPLLKTFIIRRLEKSSEADPDVLSDYILALLRHDHPPEQVRQTCITQLADFMTSGNSSVKH
jgi:hypothetical protein